jgi:hypothetical protein
MAKSEGSDSEKCRHRKMTASTEKGKAYRKARKPSLAKAERE